MLCRFFLIVFAVLVISMVSGCDTDKDQFSGLSEMVADRQKVRRDVSKKTRDSGQEELSGGSFSASNVRKSPEKSKREISSGILFEKQIEILDAQSKVPLAMGVAYLDKQGRIVRIKIIKN